ncbi:chymotrypsin family serine protease [Arthrobacter sp. B2a2-09]|uniref:hypothetical protein n=1 Tax=Arthrobacter sp. B2a2-09 TaxID=2952822 RepID=UPI0022CD375E|nr:hypothetical protein [Arthrobacter sp. B2a2-09]MCZ9885018.1 S1 family peptidase [Arthrobacter sp. B2a2-09]
MSGNNIPAGTRLVQASDDDQRLTAGENAAVIAIQRDDTAKRIVTFELDAAKTRLNIYAPSVDIPDVEHLASKHLPPTRFAVKQSRYSNAELQAEVTRILSTQQQVTATSRITTIGPKSDGSGLDIQINVPVMTGLSLPETPQIQSRMPVSLSVGGEISNAANRYADTPPYISGAYMEGSRNNACSTGFWITTPHTPDPIDYMLSADHCSATGDRWISGIDGQPGATREYLGTAVGQARGGNDFERLQGYPSKAPYVYWGTHLTTDIAGIMGWTGNPVINNSVCYSGSFTGTICSNAVSAVDQTVCYAFLQCYSGLTITNQTAGHPAAGNGDSGGPVLSVINGSVYASGIISGIQNASTNCLGIPGSAADGGRKCSSRVIYAPISHFFANNGGHVLYVASIH